MLNFSEFHNKAEQTVYVACISNLLQSYRHLATVSWKLVNNTSVFFPFFFGKITPLCHLVHPQTQMISLLCPVIMLLHQQKIHMILQEGEEVFLTRISCLPLSTFGGQNKR